MKKVFSLFMLGLVALLPIVTKADEAYVPNCGNPDANGIVTCTLTYNFTGTTNADSLVVTLTEEGGADVQTVTNAEGSDWTVTSQEENAGVWTVILTSPGVTGAGDLFTFQYKASGTEDCKVRVSVNNQTVEVVPPTTPNEKEDNKQTGATLPYIALGAIVLVATGAYLATRNKAKMYRI